MNDQQTREFKILINGFINLAIEDNGGTAYVDKAYAMMPSILDFMAGWVACRYTLWLQASLMNRRATQEELRRMYDLVRLRLDTGSATS